MTELWFYWQILKILKTEHDKWSFKKNKNDKEIVANKETVEIFDTLGKDLTNLILIGYIKGMANCE